MTGLQNKTIVLFGGTGDLTFNKLLPALYDLVVLDETLTQTLNIVLIGRREYNNEIVWEKMKDFLIKQTRFKNLEHFDLFKNIVHYYKMDFLVTDTYFGLKDYLQQFGKQYLFYLATGPDQFATITSNLDYSGILLNAKSKQLLIEKPFGENLESARLIDMEIKSVFKEEEIYRIDHYLAKEMMMNILTLRFTNQVFKRLWDEKSIESIQITAFEENSINDRGGYYDKVGALQDMFQSHLLQIVSYILMPKPKSTSVEDIHVAQQIALDSLKIPSLKKFNQSIVKGQYEGYRDENKVDPNSNTETYVALQLNSKLKEWKNVPIYVRTGKCMGKQSTYVAITFKPVQGLDQSLNQQNVLIIRIGPDEGIYFKVNIKKPGHTNIKQSIWMDFCQSCIFENRLNTPKAYERLFHYAFEKDRTLFTSWTMAERSWEITEKIQRKMEICNTVTHSYKVGSLGPEEAQHLPGHLEIEWVDEEVYGEQVENQF